LTAGFTILADQGHRPLRPKGGLRVGDRLVLTKPLGTGILLAAHMRALCRAEWMTELLQSMLQSNRAAAAVADEFDITGVTDITGFGLAGHLLEMLHASGRAARLELSHVPLLRGVEELIRDQGIESTLAPANRAVEDEIDVTADLRSSPKYATLFDPQTCGGLLLGVPPRQVDDVMSRLSPLHSLPLSPAVPVSVIGEVVAHEPGQPRIHATS
jgi:selenide,water dikinase